MWHILLLAIHHLPEEPLHEIPISHEHPDIPVDVGFCEGNDHLQFGIGGSRLSLEPHGKLGNGIFGRFELWAPEGEILRSFDHCLGTDPGPNETLVLLTVIGAGGGGWTDIMLNRLRTEPGLLEQMKAILLKQIRLFRESPIVERQTALYKAARTGTTPTT